MSSRAAAGCRSAPVSVIVPTCGRVAKLARALRSILRQTHQDWECWVVNDDPSDADAVAALVRELGDARLRLLSNPSPAGPSASRNRALDHSRGSIVAFLDDDDVWLPRKLEWHVVEHLAAPHPCAVYSDVVFAWEDGVLPPFRAAPNPPPADVVGALRAGRFMTATMSALSLDRACFERVGRFDPALDCMEDLDLLLRVASQFEVRYVAKHATVYVAHPGARLSTDLEVRLAGLAVLVERWETPEIAHRLWVRDRVCLHRMVGAALTRPLLHRLAELGRYGEVARLPGLGRLGWTLRGIARDPRSFLRLCAFALFGMRLHRAWRRFRCADPVARDLVGDLLAAREGPVPNGAGSP